MDNQLYKDYNTLCEASCKDGRKYTFRQVFVCTGPWVIYFLTGLSFGVPTVAIPQIRRNANSTDAVSPEMASWLSCIFGYTAIPWVFILLIIAGRVGRKIPFAMVALNTTCYNLVLYFSTIQYTSIHILIAAIMQGMNHACLVSLTVIIVSEYSSPKHRGLFLTIKTASCSWGVWVANAVGTYFPWKYISVIGICISVYPITIVFWPESPQWLASKGRYSECRKAHRWLRGTDKESERELESLITSQNENIVNHKESFLQQVTQKCFYKPTILSIIMLLQYHLTGKLACSMYAIEIIKRITNDEPTAYTGMLILDGVTVAGMYVGCILTKFIKRRNLFLTATVIGLIFIFVISLYLYMIELCILRENSVVSICLLMGYSVAISMGPVIMSTSIYGELTPLKYRSSMMIVVSIFFTTSVATTLKISPYLIKYMGMHGAFLFYGMTSSVLFLCLFKYLPETKDKTLQEIEDELRGVNANKNESKELLSCKKP